MAGRKRTESKGTQEKDAHAKPEDRKPDDLDGIEAIEAWAVELVAVCPRSELEGLLQGYESRANGRLPKFLRTEAANRAQALRTALEQSPE